MTERNGGQLAARQLKAAGIDTLFCVVAGPMIEVLSGAVEEGLSVVNCRHEVSAGLDGVGVGLGQAEARRAAWWARAPA